MEYEQFFQSLGEAFQTLGAGRISHAQARAVVEQAFANVFPGETASLGTLQLIQATGLQEGSYGSAWGGVHNWGAVQPSIGHPDCPPGTVAGSDSNPETGNYVACLKVYPDDVSGATDMLRIMTRTSDEKAALLQGDNEALARAMFAAGYYTGTHYHNPEANIQDRIKFIGRGAQYVASGLGEPLSINNPAGVSSLVGTSGLFTMRNLALAAGAVVVVVTSVTLALSGKRA